MALTNDNSNWVFDCGFTENISVPGGELLSLWSSHNTFLDTNSLSVEFDDSFQNTESFEENGSRKRTRPPGSKACREKMRRDRQNHRFVELSSLLDPGRHPKADKSNILVDAVRMVNQLRKESQKQKGTNENLQNKISELAEKNELRNEKQKLKTEKECLEQRMKYFSNRPSFMPHPPAMPTPFPASGQVVGSKLVPIVGYPGVPMWQFASSAALDTSQDPTLHPPVA